MYSSSIYIVDDDSVYLNLYKAMLGSVGYGVSGSPSAAAIDWVALDASALLILDLMMPDQDGLDILASLEERGYRGRVLLVTGVHIKQLAAPLKRIMSSSLAISGILEKPFFMEQLHRAVKAALSPGALLPFCSRSCDDLRQAIGRNGFMVDYAPVYRAGTGDVAELDLLVALDMMDGYVAQSSYISLVYYADLSEQYLGTLLTRVALELGSADAVTGIPVALLLPGAVLLQPDSVRQLCQQAASFTRQGLVLALGMPEMDYLLQRDAYRHGLDLLKESGARLFLDEVEHALAADAMPLLTRFDELRLAQLPRRHGVTALAAGWQDLRLLERLHGMGIALTVTKADALVTLEANQPFSYPLFSAPGVPGPVGEGLIPGIGRI